MRLCRTEEFRISHLTNPVLLPLEKKDSWHLTRSLERATLVQAF